MMEFTEYNGWKSHYRNHLAKERRAEKLNRAKEICKYAFGTVFTLGSFYFIMCACALLE